MRTRAREHAGEPPRVMVVGPTGSSQTVDIEEGLNLMPPLAFYFGDLSVNKDNLGLYHHLCGQVFACLKANQENRTNFAPGGFVALKLIAAALHINFVVVMNDAELAKELRADLRTAGQAAEVHEMARPDGVVVRPQQFRREQRGLRLREYFCGVKTVLKPARCVVSFDKVQIYKIGATGRGCYLPAYLAPR
eukprot:gene16826-55113_t